MVGKYELFYINLTLPLASRDDRASSLEKASLGLLRDCSVKDEDNSSNTFKAYMRIKHINISVLTPIIIYSMEKNIPPEQHKENRTLW